MKSIRARLTVFFSIICIGCLLVARVVSIVFTRSSLTKTNDRLYEQQAAHYASRIDSWMQENTRDVDAACAFLSAQTEINDAVIRPVMESFTSHNENAGDINVGFENKQFIDGTGWYPDADWDCTGRPWYTDAKAAGGEKYFGDPYVDAITGEMIISVSKSFQMASGMEGVVNMDLKLGTLFDMVNSMRDDSEGSYGFLVNANGMILMHPNTDYMATDEQLTTISDINNGAYEAALNSGKEFMDYDGGTKLLQSAVIDATGWQELLVTPLQSYNKAVNEMVQILTIVAVIAALIAAVLVILYTGVITKPIAKIQKQINTLQDLNLKEIDITEIRQKDEIGRMNHGVLQLQQSLGNVIRQMGESSEVLSVQYDNVYQMVDHMMGDNTDLRTMLDQILQAISEEAGQIQTANMSLNDFAQEIDKISAHIVSMGEGATKTINQSKTGVDAVRVLADKFGKTRELQDQAYHTVTVLEERSKTIDDISQTISSIAEQTALLALNASIEAARAGEFGKGFAVVAEEIGKLAKATSEATANITSIVTEIQSEITLIGSQMSSMKDETEKCMDAMDETRTVFDVINTEITEVGTDISGLEHAVETINKDKSNIVDRFADISAETQELSASSQEVLTKVDNQNDSMEAINTSVGTLHTVVKQLDEIMANFTV